MSQTAGVSTHNGPRRRGALLPALVIVTVLVLLFVLFTNIWTDKLWFDSLGFPQVFATTFWSRVGLFAVFGLLMAAAVVGNTALAYRLRPTTRSGPMASELLERYRETMETRFVQVMIGLGVVTALLAGVSAASELTTFLAWRNATPFGEVDPRFGLDVSFYVFAYPWWRFVISFAATLFAFSTIAAAVMHYVMGALRVARNERRRTSPKAQAHLSVLIGLTVLCFAVSAFFDRYAYQITTNRLLTGMSYTDDHARVNASLVVAVITALCAALFLANIWLQRWLLPLAALALTVVASVLLTMLYPAGVQGLEVNPNEPDKERPYIEQHIAATRDAYGIDNAEISNYAVTNNANPAQLRADADALPGIRLIDPAVVAPTFEQLQQVRGYYSFPSVLDVDRYQIDGRETDTVVAARELNLGGLQDRSWNNIRTTYTHGYGLVAAYGNQRDANGAPVWIDLQQQVGDYEKRIYFGEQHTDYSIVGGPAGSTPLEIDSPNGGPGGSETRTTYTGKGGVPIGNWFDRVLYATRFADANILLSRRVNPESKIIYNRTPQERVQAAAPWLQIDSNAYPTIVDGRVQWVLDGYTTTNNYPNSRSISWQQTITDSQTPTGTQGRPDTQINYLRNSVKATVDAYDGTVKLYAWDEADPILQTWRKVFPGAVSDKSTIPPALLEHLRYPDDQVKVQRQLLTRYHVTDPFAWFQGNDLWVLPTDPVTPGAQKERPYLLSIRLPGQQQPTYSQTSVFVPNQRENLGAYLAVNSEATSPDYGKLQILRMTATEVRGPNQVYNDIRANNQIADRLRAFQQSSAAVIPGNLLSLPLAGGVLYAQPYYTQRGDAGPGSFPALQFVTVRFGEKTGVGDTLQQALDQVFGAAGASTGEQPEGGAPPPPGPGQPQDLPAARQALQDADRAYAEAGNALRSGDLATYQQKNEEAAAAVRRAASAMGN
ncbi:UPF0182 family membrane protein [Enemella evansiae]|uniref:Uncharacterized protein n=1 Tax=Enemella evansiae TaxID=2016499 RepID=A0A255GIS6_9ACTN|nr:UPF0182 family protein [Enemella evansiae]PFG67590.1 hypothetical protein B0O41_2410 [Propionibacteriaceae bacterium ES.041]OYN98903.1 hypothetical protein CGZ96_06425 [Enemella evansiae]OYO01207.1 hypothetical protein CGZ97_17380 [Enemella evansiae]OYO05071.1 hypothetical protein CGZ95_01855 [Enemella evansiae]OYO07533.1 hypothetical protein CGZ98_18990 [Enemella evansiae]